MGNESKSSDRVMCQEDGCNKDYASRSGMKEHMKKTHQSVVISMMQNVVNFLSPQTNKVSEVETLTSPKELFTESDNDEEEEALNEAIDDHEIYRTAERAAQIEALKVPITPDGEWLSHTMPSGDLNQLLAQAGNQKYPQEASKKAPANVLTHAQCVLGKEENKKAKFGTQSVKRIKADSAKRVQ